MAVFRKEKPVPVIHALLNTQNILVFSTSVRLIRLVTASRFKALYHAVAAVHADELSGDVITFIGCQKDKGRGNVIGFGKSF